MAQKSLPCVPSTRARPPLHLHKIQQSRLYVNDPLRAGVQQLSCDRETIF